MVPPGHDEAQPGHVDGVGPRVDALGHFFDFLPVAAEHQQGRGVGGQALGDDQRQGHAAVLVEGQRDLAEDVVTVVGFGGHLGVERELRR
ncbi:hypothetical protein, partial [Thiohalocapsa sp.]|uniref:hypothetical protein n=1 Tax=Thiohalocapsa sp. TaxID=2497641 RepID=UPI0025E0CD6D